MSSDVSETRDAAIEVTGLGKRYEIYDRPYQRLLQTILRGRRTFYPFSTPASFSAQGTAPG